MMKCPLIFIIIFATVGLIYHFFNSFQLRCKFMDANTPFKERKQIYSEMSGSSELSTDVFLMSPEQLVKPELSSSFNRAIDSKKIKLIVLDEAHCASDWSSFRPSFMAIPRAIPKLASIPLLLMSATFSNSSLLDVLTMFQQTTIAHVLGTTGRENVKFEVFFKGTSNENCTELIKKEILKKATTKGIIVFCHTREHCEVMQKEMHEFNSVTYHSGLSAEMKQKNLSCWMNNDPNLIFATTAIGLGVNKSDVDLIVHVKVPKSLAAYYQETGRCGRDGQFAKSVLLYHFDDLDFLINKAQEHAGNCNKLNNLSTNYYRILVKPVSKNVNSN